jgi:hypothetical protein
VRRYQLDSPGSSASVDAKPPGPVVESAAIPAEADSVPSVQITPMDVDKVAEVPLQEVIKSPENVNGSTQSTEEEDLFGDSTTAEPASAMSPPRY